MWWFDSKPGTQSVFPGMIANTKASEMQYPDYPFESTKGDFPTPAEYCLYLQNYVSKFELEDYIRFNARVEKISMMGDSRWNVQITDTSINVPMAFDADYVVVATGVYQEPRWYTEDDIPGLSSFTGKQLHSSQFRSASVASQQNVLVVGMGASGVEVMRLVSGVAQEVVACSMRLDSSNTPRSFGKKKLSTPRSFSSVGDLNAVSSLRPRIRKIKGNEVTFEDKSTFKPDLIVWCSGYVLSFPFLAQDIVPVKDGRVDLYLHMFPQNVARDSLALIGLPTTSGPGGIGLIADTQSKFFAGVAAGKYSLSPQAEREEWIEASKKGWAPNMFRPLQVDLRTYIGTLNKIMGVKGVLVASSSFAQSLEEASDEEGETEEGEEEEEEGEEEMEEEESTDVSSVPVTPAKRATVVAVPNKTATDVVAPTPLDPKPRSETAPVQASSRKLTKSEGMVISRAGSNTMLAPNSGSSSTSAAAPPSNPATLAVKASGNNTPAASPSMSRPAYAVGSGSNPDLNASKGGVFGFKRTPTKDSPSSSSSNRLGTLLFGEKKGTPYPQDLLRKRIQLIQSDVCPLMVAVPASAACGDQGQRESMEDTHVLLDRIPGVPETIPSGFWAVYDGHGGAEVSRMAEQFLHVRFQKMLINALIIEGKAVDDVNVERLLKKCFKETDKQINEKLQEMKNSGVGSTAAVCVLLGKRLFVANAGDSEVVVSVARYGETKATSIEMSHKHKPRDEVEKSRIETLGGMVFGGRVYGTLSVARGFGDTAFKPPINPQFVVCPDPYVKHLEIGPQHRFVILACDGLWDKVSHEEAAEYVYGLRQHGFSLAECAQWLVNEANDRISRDNITVVVVDLQWSIDGKLENPKTCTECNAVTFGTQYCTKCGLPWGENVDTKSRQAPSVKGKRANSHRQKKPKRQQQSLESSDEEFVIGGPTNVRHEGHAQTEDEAIAIMKTK